MRRPLKLKKFTNFLAILASLSSCKSWKSESSETLSVAGQRSVQCERSTEFKGFCSVTEVSGRQSNSTAEVRKLPAFAIHSLEFDVPDRKQTDGGVTVFVTRAKEAVDQWQVDQALELYSRAECIAEVNGGSFGEGFIPKVTLRALFNTEDEGRTGFVEISDHRSGNPTHATLGIRCTWQR